MALPRHVAIIMDGNGRWAKKRLLPRIAGHKAGLEAVRRTVRTCAKKKIEVLTLFAFSSENWLRPPDEVNELMKLFLLVLQKEIVKLHENNISLKIIGDISRFSPLLQQSIRHAENLTRNNTGLKLVIAANYGGHWDITQAVQRITEMALNKEVEINAISSDLIAKCLVTCDLPEPDLFIRTSGEQRISNFLLWQLAYTELYFTDTLWPDFNDEDLDKALAFYASRDRRFGTIKSLSSN